MRTNSNRRTPRADSPSSVGSGSQYGTGTSTTVGVEVEASASVRRPARGSENCNQLARQMHRCHSDRSHGTKPLKPARRAARIAKRR